MLRCFCGAVKTLAEQGYKKLEGAAQLIILYFWLSDALFCQRSSLLRLFAIAWQSILKYKSSVQIYTDHNDSTELFSVVNAGGTRSLT